MSEVFLTLADDERAEFLNAQASKIGLPSNVLEKDIWVCWTLGEVFAIAGLPDMAFKGGTSLSKVYSVIDRFSEDIDITLSYSELDDSYDPFDPDPKKVSRNKTKEYSERLKARVREIVRDQIKPALESAAQSGIDGAVRVEAVGDEGEALRLYYPSAVEDEGQDYVGSSVLLEFGGRNSTEPSGTVTVRPYVSHDELVFPEATVQVLAAERTFWEKVTLLHSETYRPADKPMPDRLSRHLYDVVKLKELEIADRALEDLPLLERVVDIKQAFYRRAWTNYELCMQGQVRLVPEGEARQALLRDYQAMKGAGMFSKEPPSFDEIIAALTELEAQINDRIVSRD